MFNFDAVRSKVDIVLVFFHYSFFFWILIFLVRIRFVVDVSTNTSFSPHPNETYNSCEFLKKRWPPVYYNKKYDTPADPVRYTHVCRYYYLTTWRWRRRYRCRRRLSDWLRRTDTTLWHLDRVSSFSSSLRHPFNPSTLPELLRVHISIRQPTILPLFLQFSSPHWPPTRAHVL